jgi:hypothetical protein
MKVRLNICVLITTFFGFILASRGMPFDWMKLLHTLLGTAAAALGSAAFNQLMEVDLGIEYQWYVILKLLLPSTNLGGGNVVLLGDLQDALLALERLGGDTGFELGG